MKKNKNKVALLAVCMMFCFGMISSQIVSGATRKVTKVTITNVAGNKLTMSVGKTYQVKTTVMPTNASNKKLNWSSSKSTVAKVSSTGKITAVKAGTATITVKAADGSNKYARFTVSVKSKASTIQKVSLQTTTQQKLIVGETYQLKTTITPAKNAKNGVTYRSSNSKVIKVSSSGKVTAAGSGTATVTVKAKDTDTVWTTLSFKVRTYGQLSVTKSQSVAHMGLIYEAPSNSVPAFMKAATSNAFMGIESDLQETKDGEFVMYHDANISVRTNGSGLVTSLTLQQVLNATMDKGTNISGYKNLHIPTIDQYLEICRDYGMRPIIHIKNIKNYNKLLAKLKEYGLYENAIITGSKAVMTKFRSIDKQVNLYWLCYMTKGNIDWAAANNIDLNVEYPDVTQELVDYAHKKNVIVGAWTVNSYNTAKKLLYKGVDFITGDYKFANY